MRKQDFNRLSEYVWEIPVDYRDDMTVPARLYASERLMEAALGDRSVDQLVNSATLPGLVGAALAMPDIHQGYGFPIGGVVASRTQDGMISPGGVGYDICCGVRALASNIELEEIRPHLDLLTSTLYRNCPSGVGKGGGLNLNNQEFEAVLTRGAEWALDEGYAEKQDVLRTEENGLMEAADPEQVSKNAWQRGISQVGTLGSGNHFIEIDIIDEVYDEQAASAMGLVEGCIAVQIHCGSRGFGHQVCTDYVRSFQSAIHKYNISIPDRELIYMPFNSPEGQAYYGAMCTAANYAFVNRQVLTSLIRNSFEEVLRKQLRDWSLSQVYDITHNMAKVEEHVVDGKPIEVTVHRKGATRAFGPGFEGLPAEYRDIGQPVLVPGSMGTSSWILVGTAASMEQTFGSSCHGAGRTMSRNEAKRSIQGEKLRIELKNEGITIRAGSMSGLAEEAPQAYKDVDEVVKVVSGADIARKVARLVPVAVIKG
ncbi:MAG: RtcB family protein [Anaerolineae bacterium]|nr:RtcB family protein [Anaerolineae bacterium]